MLPAGARLLVAISGGQDSCALLHALSTLRAEYRLNLHAAHLNNGRRASAAVEDARFVEELCSSLGVAVEIGQADVSGSARRLHLSTQAAARRARIQFRDTPANRLQADRVALGHTADDRAE